MAGSVTLVEMAKTSEGLSREVIELFAQNSDILDALRYSSDGVSNGAYRYNLEGALPGIAFRGINEGYTASAGIINPQVETLKVVGGEVKVDTMEVKWKGMQLRSRQSLLKVKAMTATVTDKILKGDNSTEPREFDGLQTRLPLTGSQTISNATGSGGAALKLKKLMDLQDAVQNPTHFIMNRTMRTWLSMAHSDTGVSGYLGQTKDSWGRIQHTFNGLPILVGYEAGPNTAILPFSEAHFGGGAANGTSIYCVNLSDTGLQMLQGSAPVARDLGEMESEPSFLTRVEWDVSPVIENPYSVARLSSITDAAVTRT